MHYALENIQRTRRRQQQQQRVRYVHLRGGDQHPVGRRGPRHRRNYHPGDDVGRQAPATSTTKSPATSTKTTPPTPTTTSTAAATEKVCRPVQELRQLARAGDERVSAQVVQRQHGDVGPAARPRTCRQLPTHVESFASAERHRRRHAVVSDAESGQRHADDARRRTGPRRRSRHDAVHLSQGVRGGRTVAASFTVVTAAPPPGLPPPA